MKFPTPPGRSASFAFLIFCTLALSVAAKDLIALMGAYPPEMKALHAEFGIGAGPTASAASGFTTTYLKGVRFDRGMVDGHDVVIFRAGSSLVNAAYQLQLALDNFPITHVLFAGVAGGVDPELHVGDVVIPETWAYHGESAYLNEDGRGGYVMPGYLKPRLENYGMMFPSGVRATREGEPDQSSVWTFAVDVPLLARARQALPKLPPMKTAGRTVKVSVGGTGVSGTVFLDNAPYREWVYKVWQARCVDMESTAYAHVCWANRKPLLVIRGLSDLAGGQHGLNPINDNELGVAEIATKVLRAVLNELPK